MSRQLESLINIGCGLGFFAGYVATNVIAGPFAYLEKKVVGHCMQAQEYDVSYYGPAYEYNFFNRKNDALKAGYLTKHTIGYLAEFVGSVLDYTVTVATWMALAAISIGVALTLAAAALMAATLLLACAVLYTVFILPIRCCIKGPVDALDEVSSLSRKL